MMKNAHKFQLMHSILSSTLESKSINTSHQPTSKRLIKYTKATCWYSFIKVSALSIRGMMSGRLMPEGGAADAADITEGLRDGDELDFDGFVRAVSGAERRSTG